MKKGFSLILAIICGISFYGCTSIREKTTFSEVRETEDIFKEEDKKDLVEKKEEDNLIKENEDEEFLEEYSENEIFKDEIEKENFEDNKEDLANKEIQNDENSKITIVIDPGHSNKSSNETEPVSPNSNELKLKDTLGSIGVSTKIPEYETTVSISLKLKESLERKGFNVILTKDSIFTPLSNIERANIANNANANLAIRIHCDSFGSSDAKGASMLVPAVNGYITQDIVNISSDFGRKIIDTYTSEVGISNRGLVSRSDLTGFNWSKVPVVLLELGFISNPTEDNFLSRPANHTKIAEAIANGIEKCF